MCDANDRIVYVMPVITEVILVVPLSFVNSLLVKNIENAFKIVPSD